MNERLLLLESLGMIKFTEQFPPNYELNAMKYAVLKNESFSIIHLFQIIKAQF